MGIPEGPGNYPEAPSDDGAVQALNGTVDRVAPGARDRVAEDPEARVPHCMVEAGSSPFPEGVAEVPTGHHMFHVQVGEEVAEHLENRAVHRMVEAGADP